MIMLQETGERPRMISVLRGVLEFTNKVERLEELKYVKDLRTSDLK